MGLFSYARRTSHSCARLPGLGFHVCALPGRHSGPCRFDVLVEPPPVVRRPDPETLRRRRVMVWKIADEIERREQAVAAWGSPGLTKRLALASKVLDLLKRNQGLDGGQQAQVELP